MISPIDLTPDPCLISEVKSKKKLIEILVPFILSIVGFIHFSHISGLKTYSRHQITLSKGNRKTKTAKKGIIKSEPYKMEKGASFYDILLESLQKTKTCALIRLENKFGCVYTHFENECWNLMLCTFDKIEWLKYDVSLMLSNTISDNYQCSTQVTSKNLFKSEKSTNVVSFTCKPENIQTEVVKLKQGIQNLDMEVITIVCERLRNVGNIYHIENMNQMMINLLRNAKNEIFEEVIHQLEENTNIVLLQKRRIEKINDILN